MKIKKFSAVFSRVLIIIFAAIILVTLVKAVNILLITGSLSVIFSNKLVLQLLSVAIIPDVLTYFFLIACGYYLMEKNSRLQKANSEKMMEMEKKKASFETAQKMTGLMIDVIGEYNNQIKQWIHVRQQKGQQPPQKVEHASAMIGKSLKALTEFSYIFPYHDLSNRNMDAAIEDLRLRLKDNSQNQYKQISAEYHIQ